MGGYNSSEKGKSKKTTMSNNNKLGEQSVFKSIPEAISSFVFVQPKRAFHGSREDIFRAYMLLSHTKFELPMDIVRYITIFLIKVCPEFLFVSHKLICKTRILLFSFLLLYQLNSLGWKMVWLWSWFWQKWNIILFGYKRRYISIIFDFSIDRTKFYYSLLIIIIRFLFLCTKPQGKKVSYSFPNEYVKVSPKKIFQGNIQQGMLNEFIVKNYFEKNIK